METQAAAEAAAESVTSSSSHGSGSSSSGRRRRRSQPLLDEDNAQAAATTPRARSSVRQCCDKVKTTLTRHAAFVGPGIVASVAYADPGNWATDLEAGASHGYKLLFAVLLSGLFAILLQVLACRLGIVTGLDLACSSRQLILGPFGARGAGSVDASAKRPRWEKWARYGGLWTIYLIAEAAIVATELAELVGSAIALNLLFPKLPLWAGVLVTSADVFLILFVYRPNGGLRAFEVLIGALVIIVLACYVVLLVRVKPDWPRVFEGYLPSATLVQHDALYIAVGILGATVMPHGLFLGSHFSTVDRLNRGCECDVTASPSSSATSLHEIEPGTIQEHGSRRSERVDNGNNNNKDDDDAVVPKTIKDKTLHLLVRMFPRIDVSAFVPFSLSSSASATASASRAAQRQRTKDALRAGPRIPDMLDPDTTPTVRLATVKTHLPHASIDIALSLLAFAITINSAILIVAAAATRSGEREVGDLFEAFQLLRDTVGQGAAVLFAIALLAAGQSASLTVCLAGQIISEGFIRWRTSPLTRRLLTRVIAMVPSLIVAASVGKDGVDSLLVGSQVVLSMALPFVTAPLLIMTCRKTWMRVWESSAPSETRPAQQAARQDAVSPSPSGVAPAPAPTENAQSDGPLSITATSTPTPAAATATASTTATTTPPELESGGRWHHFQTWWPVSIVAWAVFGIICVADVFTLATL